MSVVGCQNLDVLWCCFSVPIREIRKIRGSKSSHFFFAFVEQRMADVSTAVFKGFASALAGENRVEFAGTGWRFGGVQWCTAVSMRAR